MTSSLPLHESYINYFCLFFSNTESRGKSLSHMLYQVKISVQIPPQKITAFPASCNTILINSVITQVQKYNHHLCAP